MQQTLVLIVGASLSGLACAAALQKRGISYIIIEKEAQIATPWRNHYERLHLHTTKNLSRLPFKKWNHNIPRYPSRRQVVDYAEEYAKENSVCPLFCTQATFIKREKENWVTETSNGIFCSTYIIVATGAYGKPKTLYCKGIETFPGPVLHSCQYKTGKAFTQQQVLVIGFGNSACEIAIDLYEQGASVCMSVRSPVNIIPRDLWGISVLRIGLLLSTFPSQLADAIVSPVVRLLFGDIAKLGLQKLPYGVFTQIEKDGTIPLIDIGTIEHIRQKHITIFDDISCIENKTVYFKNGKQKDFDAIIAAIGYERNDVTIGNVDNNRFDDATKSVGKQKQFGVGGLYFCGFRISPNGLIREISLEAQKIAKHIAEKERI